MTLRGFGRARDGPCPGARALAVPCAALDPTRAVTSIDATPGARGTGSPRAPWSIRPDGGRLPLAGDAGRSARSTACGSLSSTRPTPGPCITTRDRAPRGSPGEPLDRHEGGGVTRLRRRLPRAGSGEGLPKSPGARPLRRCAGFAWVGNRRRPFSRFEGERFVTALAKKTSPPAPSGALRGGRGLWWASRTASCACAGPGSSGRWRADSLRAGAGSLGRPRTGRSGWERATASSCGGLASRGHARALTSRSGGDRDPP